MFHNASHRLAAMHLMHHASQGLVVVRTMLQVVPVLWVSHLLRTLVWQGGVLPEVIEKMWKNRVMRRLQGLSRA